MDTFINSITKKYNNAKVITVIPSKEDPNTAQVPVTNETIIANKANKVNAKANPERYCSLHFSLVISGVQR